MARTLSALLGVSLGSLTLAASLPSQAALDLEAYALTGVPDNNRYFQRDLTGEAWVNGAPIRITAGVVNHTDSPRTLSVVIQACHKGSCSSAAPQDASLKPRETWSATGTLQTKTNLQDLVAPLDPQYPLVIDPGDYELRIVATDKVTAVVASHTALFKVRNPDAKEVVLSVPEQGQYYMRFNVFEGVNPQEVALEWYDPMDCNNLDYILRVLPPGKSQWAEGKVPVEDLEECGRKFAFAIDPNNPAWFFDGNGTYFWSVRRASDPASFSQERWFQYESDALQMQEAATRVTGASAFTYFEIPAPFLGWEDKGVDFVSGWEALRVAMDSPAEAPTWKYGFAPISPALPGVANNGSWLRLQDGNIGSVRSIRWQRRFRIADANTDILKGKSFFYAGLDGGYEVPAPTAASLPPELVQFTETDALGYYTLPEEVVKHFNAVFGGPCKIQQIFQEIDSFATNTVPSGGTAYTDMVLQLSGLRMDSFDRWIGTTRDIFGLQHVYGCYHASRIKTAMARHLGIPAVEVVLASGHGYPILWLPFEYKDHYALSDGQWTPFVSNELVAPYQMANMLKTTGWTGSKHTRQHSHWNDGVAVDYEWGGGIDRAAFAADDLRLLLTWPVISAHKDAFRNQAASIIDHMFQLDTVLYGMTFEDSPGNYSLLLAQSDPLGRLPVAEHTVPLTLQQLTTLDLSQYGGTRVLRFIPRRFPVKLGARYLVLDFVNLVPGLEDGKDAGQDGPNLLPIDAVALDGGNPEGLSSDAAGDLPAPPASAEDAGCGCRLAPADTAPSILWLLVVATLASTTRRHKNRQPSD